MHDKVTGAVRWSLCESNGVDSNDTGIRLNQSHRLKSVTRSSATADKPRDAFLPHAMSWIVLPVEHGIVVESHESLATVYPVCTFVTVRYFAEH